MWVDKERDIIHLHWTGRADIDWGPSVLSHLDRIESVLAMARAGCSIDRGYLYRSRYCALWKEDRAVLERIGRVAVCFNMVCIHADEGSAIASELFGMFGEECISLVDALDYDRLKRLWALWDAHRGKHPDPLTFDFFSECHAQQPGSEVQNRWTQNIHDDMEDIKQQWVLDNWEEQEVETPDWSEREQVWLATPDWVPTRDYKQKHRQRHRRGYMSKWVPKLDRPWMKQAYSHMPEFRPVIMFRLCTDTYYLEQGTRCSGRLGCWEDTWRVKRT